MVLAYMGFAQSAPKVIFLDSMNYNMGSFKSGEAAEHTFKFVNVGNAPFKILDVKSTCSCTASNWTSDFVQAGDTGSIHITFDTKEKMPGEHLKGVNLETNAGDLHLVIRVTITEGPSEIMEEEDHQHDGHKH